ncbi:class I SAM-dependent methyltransferase [Paramicrobacterium chengjingii]|uniref:class I SAM-dependent methyltransferase n=1 Tax=Paramicrobacterium chengjingii TaxID=2769067 RepID=UPI0014239150|nr:class I SAM-dependent methyltransferase [Microbacterium chengjingii]
MSFFASTADYYRRFRSGIPEDVSRVLSESAPNGSPRRLLDVGTGTGFVVQALLPYFDEAIGVDVDEELLAVARADTSDEIANRRARFIHGPAESLTLEPGWLAHLVTVCRAFHWFDRPAFLTNIIGYMADGATLSVFGDRSIWAGGQDWKIAARDVVQEVLGEARRAGPSTYGQKSGSFIDDLDNAGFTGITARTVPARRTHTVDSMIGLLHSTSFASPAVLGDRIDHFDARIREELSPLTDEEGTLVDDNEFYIYTGTRP